MSIAEATPIPHPPGKAARSLEHYEYYIPEFTSFELDRHVSKLEAQKLGVLVGQVDFSEEIDRAKVVATLPEDISENTFTNMVMLALLTESATNSYALVFDESSDKYNAPWLRRFINNIWVPDEQEHADPFKWILLKFGYAEEELNRRVKITQEATYEHNSGNTPAHFTTFGSEQEYLTADWYGIIYPLLEPAAPRAAKRVKDVRAREALHTGWYNDLTLIQIKGNPELVHYVAETTSRFSMPQNHLDPGLRELQASMRSIALRDNRADSIEHNIMRLMNYSMGDNTHLFGTFILDFIARLKGGERTISTVQAISQTPLLGDALTTLAAQTAYKRGGIKHEDKDQEKLFKTITTPLRSMLLSRMQGFKLS